MTACKIKIDGQSIDAEVGEMLIAAADRAGIYIPRFCYHPKLSIAANCRMCLVEVAPGGKPLPACATPVAADMKVSTQSKLAREAQQGTLEFLLINHPLDCPVCDQGGECPLQDQAMGYGNDDSRFDERKRAVASRDIGPLVATEMTRCIHCTRCVRFGDEVAGMMEMGFPGRGEEAWIGTFLNRSVDSEVSGNMIDLCPVGALTSKPYRFAARAWELQNHRGVSPHDCVGANINIQTLRGRVERVLPIENAAVNDCWLADRDRYSYQAVNSDARLTAPMVKERGQWKQVSWEEALKRASAAVKKVVDRDPAQFAALAGYTATLEEYYLLQKLTRALGSHNIDHRLQQTDFRDDPIAPAFPASELPIAQFEQVKAALLVGSNLRKEQPLLALRLRVAVRNEGACIGIVNPIAYRQNFDAHADIAAGADLAGHVAAIAAEVAKAAKVKLPQAIAEWSKRVTHSSARQSSAEVARRLVEAGGKNNGGNDGDSGGGGVVIVGALTQQHADASVIKAIAQWICETSGARLAILPPGNSAAAWLAGCVPHRDNHAAVESGGDNAAEIFSKPRRAYLLMATDPQLDGIDGRSADAALKNADCVVCMTAYQNDAMRVHADVLLPMAAFTESAGTFINCEGRAQHANAAAAPLGEARPAWKILRVLGNFLDLDGFEFMSLNEVRDAVGVDLSDAPASWSSSCRAHLQDWQMPTPTAQNGKGARFLMRLLDVPIYRGDQTVRNAKALQATADNPPPAVRVNHAMIDSLKLTDGEKVLVKNGKGAATLPIYADDRVPADCAYVPCGYADTIALGGHGRIALEKAK